jgi:hypothetical protein
MRFPMVLSAMVAGLVAGPLAAQEPVAPRVVENGQSYDIRIEISGYGIAPDRNNPPMRTAEEITSPKDWFDDRSALVKAVIADPALEGSGGVRLTIDPAGIVTGCNFETRTILPGGEEAVCQDLAQQRFKPALAEDGTKITGQYRVYISRLKAAVESSAKPQTLIVREQLPRPVMYAVAPQLRSYDFPPALLWLQRFYREPDTWGMQPRRGGADIPLPGAATGVILSWDGSAYLCDIARRSTDADLDRRACGYVRDTLVPVWNEASAEQPKAIPLMVVRSGDALSAWAPPEDRNDSAEFGDNGEAAFISALSNAGVFPLGRESSPLEMAIDVGIDGTVKRCRIMASSGSDAGDIDACRIARSIAEIEPRRELFGRPYEESMLYWRARDAEE